MCANNCAYGFHVQSVHGLYMGPYWKPKQQLEINVCVQTSESKDPLCLSCRVYVGDLSLSFGGDLSFNAMRVRHKGEQMDGPLLSPLPPRIDRQHSESITQTKQ